MSRAHKENVTIASVQSNQVRCGSRNDTVPILESIICQSPAYGIVQEKPTVDTKYHENSVLDIWPQSKKPFNTVSFNNLGHVFGSWDLSDLADPDSDMKSAEKSLSQQSDSSIFRIDRGHTRRDLLDSLFCTWDAVIDYNALSQLEINVNGGQSSQLKQPAILEPTMSHDQSQLNHVSSELRSNHDSVASSSDLISISHIEGSINSLFCTWDAGVDTNVLPQPTNIANQDEYSEPSLILSFVFKAAIDCELENYAGFQIKILDYFKIHSETHHCVTGEL